MYFCVDEFELGVNDSIFSGNEHQKVYMNAEKKRKVTILIDFDVVFKVNFRV